MVKNNNNTTTPRAGWVSKTPNAEDNASPEDFRRVWGEMSTHQWHTVVHPEKSDKQMIITMKTADTPGTTQAEKEKANAVMTSANKAGERILKIGVKQVWADLLQTLHQCNVQHRWSTG